MKASEIKMTIIVQGAQQWVFSAQTGGMQLAFHEGFSK